MRLDEPRTVRKVHRRLSPARIFLEKHKKPISRVFAKLLCQRQYSELFPFLVFDVTRWLTNSERTTSRSQDHLEVDVHVSNLITNASRRNHTSSSKSLSRRVWSCVMFVSPECVVAFFASRDVREMYCELARNASSSNVSQNDSPLRDHGKNDYMT